MRLGARQTEYVNQGVMGCAATVSRPRRDGYSLLSV